MVISQEYSKNIDKLFEDINKLKNWDILFTCLSHTNSDTDSIELFDSRINFKILLSKSSYFINPFIVSRLNEYLKIYKYSLKLGISKFIWDNKDIKSYTLNKHIFLEGSKLGLLLSSTNNNNILYQNSDFISLARITNYENITQEQFKEALQIYKRLSNLNSADALHTMGILYYKMGDYENSKKYLIDAIINIKKNNGYLTNSSEILNNCINMHQYNQIDLEECMKKQSKYSN
jgi:tetratricopeptide (TPR) repeat protein